MRLPKPSSASVPTIACSGTPACRVRVPISPTSLPCRVCSSSLPSPVTTARAARMRWSKSSASSTNGAPGSRLAPRLAHRPPDRPPAPPVIGHAARVALERLRQLVEALLEPLDHRRVGALLRAEDLGGVLEDGADVAQHDDLGLADAARLLDRVQGALPAVGRGRAADRDEDHRGAGLRGGGDQLAGAVGAGLPGVPLVLRRRARGRSPSPSRRSPSRRPRSGRSRCAPGLPSGPLTSCAISSPPSCGSSASSVPSPPSATGHRSGGINPARSSPRPIAPATWAALKVPLKESGATRTGRSGTAMLGIVPETTDTSACALRPYPGVATNDIAGMQAAVGVLQSKWSVAILAELADGTHRFNELLRHDRRRLPAHARRHPAPARAGRPDRAPRLRRRPGPRRVRPLARGRGALRRARAAGGLGPPQYRLAA